MYIYMLVIKEVTGGKHLSVSSYRDQFDLCGGFLQWIWEQLIKRLDEFSEIKMFNLKKKQVILHGLKK